MAAFGQRATLAECSEWETGKNGLIGGEVTASQQSRGASGIFPSIATTICSRCPSFARLTNASFLRCSFRVVMMAVR